MLILQGVSYTHPDKEILFSDLNLVINRRDKAALIGNNGTGKSTLLKLMAGMLQPARGLVKADSQPYYVPQHFGQYNALTVAQALSVDAKLNALKEILAGNVTEAAMAALQDDWTIEERCIEALGRWGLGNVDMFARMGSLSGGQKTRVLLAGIQVHRAGIVLLDEPGNHLDTSGRELLYEYIRSATETLVVVSHDRVLLNLLDFTCELSSAGLRTYGGNYDFYLAQKTIEAEAFNQQLRHKEKELRKAKEVQREMVERQQKLDARGRKKQEKAGLPTISMNTLKNNAERSTARSVGAHSNKVQAIATEVSQLRKEVPGIDTMKIGFDKSKLHKGKILVEAKDINFAYAAGFLWSKPQSFTIASGERIVITGLNGSGKTTLARIMLGELQPHAGTINIAGMHTAYIDQDYSLIDNSLTVYEQVQGYNTAKLEEHEVKSRLTHFLFTSTHWNKSCAALSGGEKLRLALCCLVMPDAPPDMIVLDEPTNNLDIQNVDLLISAIQQYSGTLVVVSHDRYFLEQVNVAREIAAG